MNSKVIHTGNMMEHAAEAPGAGCLPRLCPRLERARDRRSKPGCRLHALSCLSAGEWAQRDEGGFMMNHIFGNMGGWAALGLWVVWAAAVILAVVPIVVATYKRSKK
jgi:hypothetical protein